MLLANNSPPPPNTAGSENYSSRPLRRVHCGTPVALGRGKKKRNGALNDVGGWEDVVVVAASSCLGGLVHRRSFTPPWK